MSGYGYGYYNDKDRINEIIKEYLKENIDELRHDILNLDDYICREQWEEERRKLELDKQVFLDENSKLKENAEILTSKLKDAETQISATEKLLRNVEESRYYTENYKDLDDGFQCYKQLSVSLQNSLAGVIGYPKTGLEFICSISQSSNLETLWDFAAYELNNQRVEKVESINLENFFRFAFSAVNQGSNKKFVLIEPNIGDSYNFNMMQKTSKSKQLGNVCNVLLPGIQNKHSGKIIKLALVEIE